MRSFGISQLIVRSGVVITKKRTKLIAVIVATFTTMGACADCTGNRKDDRSAVIVPHDCGPKAGLGEYGVVFSGYEGGVYRSYFAKGTASQLCPLIVELPEIVGRVEKACLPYDEGIALECIDANVIDLNLAEPSH